MIKLTEFQRNVLSGNSIEAFYIIEIGYKVFENNQWQLDYKRLNTSQEDISFSNGKLYIGKAPIIELQPPKISSEVDREQYIILLADPYYEYGQFSENNFVGMPVKVGIVFIDPSTKRPNLNYNEVLLVYKGQIDSVTYNIDTGETGSVIYKIACASPVANLDATKPFYTSKAFMKEKIRADDDSFNQVQQGTGVLRLKWGRV